MYTRSTCNGSQSRASGPAITFNLVPTLFDKTDKQQQLRPKMIVLFIVFVGADNVSGA